MVGTLIAGQACAHRAAHLPQPVGEAGSKWLDPQYLAQHAALAVRLRRNILMRCYHGDYHLDVQDEGRLIAQVASGQEQILVWGAPEDIAVVARMVRERCEVSDTDLTSLSLGTHTTLPGHSLYGLGHLELARTGSTQQHTGGVAVEAICWDLARVLATPDTRRPFHTISCLPRNRLSAPGIPGGAAIHRLHTRSLGTSHWGLAPFYVMSGGMLELLDYREISVDRVAVLAAFAQNKPVYAADKSTAELIRDLCRLNGFDPQIRVERIDQTYPDTLTAPVTAVGIGDPYGPRLVAIDSDRPEDGLCRVINPGLEACTVAVCDLEDPRSALVQATLLAAGFQLTYISPPKHLRGLTTPAQRCPMRGGFTRIRTSVTLATPYYLRGGPMTPIEGDLARRYHRLIDSLAKDCT